MEAEVRIFTLNCWGLGLGISKDRDERMEDIGKYIASNEYDIVFCQEVWKRKNFETIQSLVLPKLPYSQYFDSGIIGTGTAIFSRVPINDCTFHEFGLNGYPHKLLHGDWFGGKGLGICQIDFQGFNIHLFTSHYHANYSYKNDKYLGHRIVHSVESAQWIKLSCSSADLTIYAGDFNTEPCDVPYKIVRHVTPLKDAWVEANGPEGGETSETPNNSYTAKSALKECPGGRRIDYIMYRAGPNVTAETGYCTLPLQDRVPGKTISFSDHEGVTAKLVLKRTGGNVTGRDYARAQARMDMASKLECVDQAKEILRVCIKEVRYSRIMYLISSLACLVLLFLAFIPYDLVTFGAYIGLDIALFLLRLVFIVSGTYMFLISVLFFRRESHTLRGTLATLEIITERGMEEVGSDAVKVEVEPGNII